MPRGERGVALLEVLAALAILGIAGLAAVQLTTEATRSLAAATGRERELWDAERLLSAHTLLSRRDLDLRLGTREIGDWLVNVQRPEPTLYRIAISSARAPELEALVTVVYREGGVP